MQAVRSYTQTLKNENLPYLSNSHFCMLGIIPQSPRTKAYTFEPRPETGLFLVHPKILKIGSRYGTIILSNNVLYRELFQEKGGKRI